MSEQNQDWLLERLAELTSTDSEETWSEGDEDEWNDSQRENNRRKR